MGISKLSTKHALAAGLAIIALAGALIFAPPAKAEERYDGIAKTFVCFLTKYGVQMVVKTVFELPAQNVTPKLLGDAAHEICPHVYNYIAQHQPGFIGMLTSFGHTVMQALHLDQRPAKLPTKPIDTNLLHGFSAQDAEALCGGWTTLPNFHDLCRQGELDPIYAD